MRVGELLLELASFDHDTEVVVRHGASYRDVTGVTRLNSAVDPDFIESASDTIEIAALEHSARQRDDIYPA